MAKAKNNFTFPAGYWTTERHNVVVRATQMCSSPISADLRLDFCDLLIERIADGDLSEMIVNRSVLRAFELGLLGAWSRQGATDTELWILRGAAKALKIWTWIQAALPKPEANEQLDSRDIDPDEDRVLDGEAQKAPEEVQVTKEPDASLVSGNPPDQEA
jgi:hypothetical protein